VYKIVRDNDRKERAQQIFLESWNLNFTPSSWITLMTQNLNTLSIKVKEIGFQKKKP
jgi:hypothetical protein